MRGSGKVKEKGKKKEGKERWRCRRRDVCRLSRELFSLAMTREDKENRFNFPNALAASSSASRPILRLFPPFSYLPPRTPSQTPSLRFICLPLACSCLLFLSFSVSPSLFLSFSLSCSLGRCRREAFPLPRRRGSAAFPRSLVSSPFPSHFTTLPRSFRSLRLDLT